jgi:uncharacterized membrane protein SpoIIM required for sporulation
LNLARAGRYLRPARVFLIAALLGLLIGVVLRVALRPLLNVLEQAIYYRISKPLELIEGPLIGIVGTKEAVTTIYLLANNLMVSFVAAFGGLILIRYTFNSEDREPPAQSRVTNLLHRLVGEGNDTYRDHSVLLFLLPLAVVCVNGIVLGLFSVSQGLSWREISVYLAYVMPHGIIELPAVVLAAIIGYAHAVDLNVFLDRGDIGSFFTSAREMLRSRRSWGLFTMVLVMLVGAAGIESYVTPAIGQNALRNSYFSLRVLNESVAPGETALMYVTAAFDSTITFHRGSPSGPLFDVQLVGSGSFPFEVEGRTIPDSELVTSSELTVPGNVGALLLRFRVADAGESITIYPVAEYGRFSAEGNITVGP